MVGRRRWRMELMGIGSSRIKETSRNRLYACLGCAGLQEKNPKTIVHEETISKEKRRKSMIKKCSMLKPSMFNASFPLCEILVPRSRRVVQLVPLHPSPHSTPKRMVLQYNQRPAHFSALLYFNDAFLSHSVSYPKHDTRPKWRTGSYKAPGRRGRLRGQGIFSVFSWGGPLD